MASDSLSDELLRSEEVTSKESLQFVTDEPAGWTPGEIRFYGFGPTSDFLQVFKTLICEFTMPCIT